MTIMEILATTGTRIRRQSEPQQEIEIHSGSFYLAKKNYDGDQEQYSLTVADLIADDWEFQSTDWIIKVVNEKKKVAVKK